MLLRPISRLMLSRLSSSAASSNGSTGIEHAEEFLKKGEKHQSNPNDYKVQDYLKTNAWSYYDLEMELIKFRAQQPSITKPDVAPKITKKD